MGCLRRLFRLLFLIAIIIVVVIIFLPQFFARAGNSLLTNINSSANPVSGIAQYIPANFLNKDNQLQLSLNGLDLNKKYEVTLDPGICGNSGYIDLGLVTSDDNGNVQTTFSLTPLSKNDKSWFVDVHSGTGINDPVMACSQLDTNDSSAAADATNSVLQLSPVASDLSSGQTTDATPTSNVPQGFPQTGVAPAGNTYDNNVYPRKY